MEQQHKQKRIAPIGERDNQTKRVARVLRIIQQITTQPSRWSRKDLAASHEVSERMITKDLEIIRIKLGLQLEHDGKAYRFVDFPQIPHLVYSFSEALALITAARLAQLLPGVNSADLAAAIVRLEAMFPAGLRPLLHKATEQLPQKATRSHRQEMLMLLHRSQIELRQVSMSYETASRQGKISQRIVEPYEVIPYGRSWQLIAFDYKRQAVLQFKVDRIQEATLLSTFYTVPEEFDIDEYMGDGWGAMRGEAYTPEKVVLQFESQAGRWAAEERWHKSQEVQELEDGRIEMCFLVGVTPEMVSWLLYYGENVVVERPLWLREEIVRRHKAAILKNDKPSL